MMVSIAHWQELFERRLSSHNCMSTVRAHLEIGEQSKSVVVGEKVWHDGEAVTLEVFGEQKLTIVIKGRGDEGGLGQRFVNLGCGLDANEHVEEVTEVNVWLLKVRT